MPVKKAVIPVAVALVFLFVTAVFAGHGAKSANQPMVIEGGEQVTISGTILDSHKEPINEAVATVSLNGHEVAEVETAHNGHYVTDFMVEPGAMAHASLEIEVRKTSFAAETLHLTGSDFAQKGDHYFIAENVSLDRVLGPAFWIATVVFVLAYVLIAFELLHRTVAAMFGAALMMLISYTNGTINPDFRIYTFDRAISAIDMNVIFLLMGMMIIVGILKNTGVFQWWALALGACFGGNGTIIGASANVVTMGIAESQGYKISFVGFMKTAFPYMIISIIIAQVWLMLFKPA